MPRRFPLLLLCAALVLPAPFARGQAADLQAALAGAQYPLTLKLKDLDPSWRQVSLNGPTPSGIALPQGVSPALLGSSPQLMVCFTKGQTVSVGSETFLVAYLTPIRYEFMRLPGERTDVGAAFASRPASKGDIVYKLSLVNVRQIGSLDDVVAFAPQTAEEVRKQAEAAEQSQVRLQSLSNLKWIGLAMTMYIQDYDETLPPMLSAAAVQKALLPYAKRSAVFQQPEAHAPYLPNTSLSRRRYRTFKDPADMVIYYEAAPGLDGTRAVLFLDGHVQRIPKAQWPALKAASHIPGIAYRVY